MGAYFVTIVGQGRACLFGEVVDDLMCSNDAGQMVQTVWDELQSFYPGVEVDAFVVMPNHVHGVIILTATPGQARGPAPTIHYPGAGQAGLSLGEVVQRFKMMTTRRYADGVKRLGWPAFPGRLWQRNYYEHIIRGETDLHRIRQYIEDNPARWAVDHDNPSASSPEPAGAWRSYRRGGPPWPP